MNRLGLAVAASALAGAGCFPMSHVAHAGDPPPAVFNWSGLYIGVHVGGGWRTGTVDDPYSANFNMASVTGDPVRDLNGGNFFGGGQVGWNIQSGALVFGPELSISSGVRASRADTVVGITGNGAQTETLTSTRTWNSALDWSATATMRLGYAWDRWLLYGKGGAAVTRMNYSLLDQTLLTNTSEAPFPPRLQVRYGQGLFAGNDARVGWTLGAGLEWAFWGNWSASVEYDYADFGERSVATRGATTTVFAQTGAPTVVSAPSASFVIVPIMERLQTVRFGVNYRFNSEAGTAARTDIAAPAAFNWSGAYLGAHAGWGRSTATINDPFSANGILSGTLATTNDPVRDVDGGGFLGGGQAGWNYQVRQFVVGSELSLSGSKIHGSRTDTIAGSRVINENSRFAFLGSATDTRSWTTEIDWRATATARVGHAWDRWLIYGKGGLAAAQMRYSLHDQALSTAAAPPPFPPVAFQTLASTGVFTGNDTRVGWTLGAGLEWAFWDRWSASVEYNYADFGQRSVAMRGSTGSVFTQTISPAPPFVSSITSTTAVPITERLQTVRVGVNYRFNWESAAVVA
jgi:outer membrane immunogenic protein